MRLRTLLLGATIAMSGIMAQAGCLQCDAIYATGCNFELWKIDPQTLVATQLGKTPEYMFDLAATPDGRLYAVGVSGGLWELDPCTGASVPAPGAPGGNGLGGDPTRALLFGQGPPLTRTDPATGLTTVIGGKVGSGPADWCGISTGDLAFQPGTGVLFSTIACFGTGCNGDTLINLEPSNGDVSKVVGCTRDSAGRGFPDVHGLAFDSKGILWGSLGAVVQPDLLHIDPTDASVTTFGVTGGYVCGTGLAILPCPTVSGTRCEPLTQGFWKRQCAGPHPSGEPARLAWYAPCVAGMKTFAGIADKVAICDRLEPDPPDSKCEQAEAQFMATMLNVCSGRLDPGCCVKLATTAAATVLAAIAEVDALLANPGRSFRDCVNAQAIAAAINEGTALCPTRVRATRDSASIPIVPGSASGSITEP